jgi:hypothetical protein
MLSPLEVNLHMTTIIGSELNLSYFNIYRV